MKVMGFVMPPETKWFLVLKELLRTTWQAVQSNYFVCLSNMKATLSADALQLCDKTPEKGLGNCVYLIGDNDYVIWTFHI